MAIFALSDLIIAVTLIINGMALCSTRIVCSPTGHANAESAFATTYRKICILFAAVRKMSFLILMWNVIFFVLMIMVFD